MCASIKDSDEEIRPNKVRYAITPYVALMCASVAKMGST